MGKAPESYLEARRPPLQEALKLEGGTWAEAVESLQRKGYFAPRHRPWKIGYRDRGHGRVDYAVLDHFGDLVVEVPDGQETAELIIAAVNSYATEK